MKRYILLTILLMVLFASATTLSADTSARQKVRIAAFNFYPALFQDKDGSVKGFYVDFLREIAQREKWDIEYVYGTWADGLDRIRSGKVDVLTNVAYTPERARFMDYGKVPLLTVWAELYVPENSTIENIRDVRGKKIALMRGDFNAANFRNIVEKFGIPCRFAEYGSFDEVFRAIADRQVDGGVVNNTFGSAKQSEYHLRSSGVIFNPFDIFFTVAKGQNAAILATLDGYLDKWRESEGSPYHLARDRWSHGSASTIHVISPRMKKTAFGLAALLVIAVFFAFALRIQVRRKTSELRARSQDLHLLSSRLKESEARLNLVLDNVGAHVFMKDSSYRYTYANRKTVELFGKPLADIVGRSDADFFTTESVAEIMANDRTVIERGEALTREEVNLDAFDGSPRTYLTVKLPIRDEYGAVIGLCGISTDMTEQKRAAAERDFLAEIIKNMSEGVVVASLDTSAIVYTNQKFDELFGYGAGELIGRDMAVIHAYSDPAAGEKMPAIAAQAKEHGFWQGEIENTRKDGSRFWCRATVSTMRKSSYGDVFIVVCTDITEQKQLKQILEHRLEVLTNPLDDLSNIAFPDLFNLDEIQEIQDAFAQATGVASIITAPDGTPITRPSNFCDLCLDIIRKTEKGLANCRKSDTQLGKIQPDGPAMQPCLSGGLMDGGTGIRVGNHHIANWLIGQVLDESCDMDTMLAYAREIGADEDEYRHALAKVTHMTRNRFESVCKALYQIAGQLSRMAMQNLNQAKHIEERTRAEAVLSASEGRFRELLENVELIAVTLDCNGSITFCNDFLLDVTGWRREEVLGNNWFDLFIPEQVRENIRAVFRANISRDELKHFENTILTKNGQQRLIVWDNTTLHDPDGRAIGVTSIGNDITDHRSLEEQLRQSQKMEAVGRLAGGVAHDFNNILQVISGYCGMLEMDATLNRVQHGRVLEIAAAAEKAAQLTHGLLAYSRKQTLLMKQESLNDIIRHVDRFLTRIIGEDITLETSCSDAEISIVADRGQIEQVLINLATNARDAMQSGGTFSVASGRVLVEESFADFHTNIIPTGEYALLAVSDTGTGIKEEDLDHIFEPFFTTKDVGKGTGLGMAIIYGIVKQHNGFIDVHSEPGRGTTFRIYLPVQETRDQSSIDGDMAVPSAGGSETILVAEDEPVVRSLMSEILAGGGYEVILAENGDDAVEKFRVNRERIRLVLMDMIMPKKNGREAFEEIRRIKPEIRGLFSSGYTADFIQNRGVSDEGIELIMKPVKQVELLKKVREMLDA